MEPRTSIALSVPTADLARRLQAALAFQAGGPGPSLGDVVAVALELLEKDLRRRRVPIPKGGRRR